MFTFVVMAQNNEQNIRGTVTDKLSKSPLVGVKVEISSLQKATITDSLGNYALTGILPDDLKRLFSFFPVSVLLSIFNFKILIVLSF